MSQDPYLDSETSYQRLVSEYQTHGSLVVAFDFDSTAESGAFE